MRLKNGIVITIIILLNHFFLSYIDNTPSNINFQETPNVDVKSNNSNEKTTLNDKVPVKNNIVEIENSNDENTDKSDIKDSQIVKTSNIQTATLTEQSFQSTATGSSQRLKINIETDKSIKMVDLSNYEKKYFAFLWDRGNFKWGLSNDKSLPELEVVELNDEIENTDKKFSELLSFQENDYLFIQPMDSVENLYIDIINPSSSEQIASNLSVTANHDSGAKYSSLNIIPRETWSGDPNINDPGRLTWDPVYYKIDKIVVHHTVQENNYLDTWAQARGDYVYHTYTLGWGDVGYNYIIDWKGNILEGKLGGEESKGYHAGSANANSIGIAFIGTFNEEIPSQAAQDALVRLIAEKTSLHNLTPHWHTNIYGHRDVGATLCPGQAFYNILPGLVDSARNYQATHFSSLKNAVSEAENAINNGSFEERKLTVFFDNSSSIYIPAWSRVESAQTCKTSSLCNGNIVTFTIENPSEPIFATVNDRMKTLYKIYLMNPNVENVGVTSSGNIH